MARIILGSYLVRYPLGGMVSYVMQYLIGLQRLGHDVYFVEKSGYASSCYDPEKNAMTSDCSYGVGVIRGLFDRFGLSNRFCFVDEENNYHGMSAKKADEVFRSSDLFIEMGTHEAWRDESAHSQRRILLDGDPGFSQIWLDQRKAAGEVPPEYDAYFTVGSNVGTSISTAPTAGESWHHYFHPVVTSLFPVVPAPESAPFTTVMNWESYKTVEYNGREYGHKNIEFEKFIDLPQVTSIPLEVAVAGPGVPRERLASRGWKVKEGTRTTTTVDSFWDYVRDSRGEFTVCKNGFVEMQTGWFSDRSSVYLASGRPVVMQDTGFGSHLPCGSGLFAVSTAEEAASALEEINGDWEHHSKAAREIAVEHLDAAVVLTRLLQEVGL